MSSTHFTTEAEVLSLSPDAASSKAAKGLANVQRWPRTGCDASAVWGECQGSGSKPYQTQVALAPLAYKCSCPSRKFPCKHSLALLLLYATQQVPAQEAVPDWVQAWLDSRQAQAEKKAAKAAAPATPVDPAKATRQKAQREQGRWEKTEQGLQELGRWMQDLVSKGLAQADSDGGLRQQFRHMAARMVDAQASGVAALLHKAAQSAYQPQELLPHLAHIQLLLEGAGQRAHLPAPQWADLTAALGWPQDKAEVMAQTPAQADDWLVLGQSTQEREGRLLERQVWLQGLRSGQIAWLLDYSRAGQGFEQAWATGQCYHCALHYYPSAAPLRAVLGPDSLPQLVQSSIPALADTQVDALHTLSQRMAANPLQLTQPLWGYHAQVFLAEGQWQARIHSRLQVTDTESETNTNTGAEPPRLIPLELQEGDAWQLLAHSGGHPMHLFGRWDGVRWALLSAWQARDAQHWEKLWHCEGVAS